ncbi:MAG: ferrous iron transport protein B [Verrucomicrobia bacterium]|nr:ferrous iron transport protein B [Verrucomicrobiota bacterium]
MENPTQPNPAGHRAKTAGQAPYVALTGNPNSGKTTLFNALTGLRAKVGNYAGVTVERKEGKLIGAPAGNEIRVLDLPGTYGLSPNSIDEQVSRDVLLNRLPELPAPDLIIIVVDASSLQRNLYYATQVIELGHRTILVLNMVDVAEANGHAIDAAKLSAALGVTVLPVIASTGRGVAELRARIVAELGNSAEIKPRLFCQLPGLFRIEATGLANLLAETFRDRQIQATAEALLILSNEKALASSSEHYSPKIQDAVAAARKRLDAHNVDWRGAPIEWRYARIAEIEQATSVQTPQSGEAVSDRIDRWVTHKFWGTAIFVAIMGVMFWSIFVFAHVPMDAMQAVVDWFGGKVGGMIPPGELNSLVVDGAIAGVGAVVVFLPQILLLFLFIGLLEDTGYMARAAFLMDRLMSKVGLHGKSFIPMLSSYACAIPGIMATRTIESPKDRLVTILVAPLMSCSARLPVYALLIGACISGEAAWGIPKFWQGLTMLAMYLLGTVTALLMAWLFKKTLLRSEPPMLIMELPPYKRPLLRVVLRHMWDRSKLFLRRAGTVILGINILLWFLATYPKSGGTPNAGEQLRHSFAGMAGRAIEPVIAPLGFDWKVGIGIISSFAAREVFVSTMSTVYNVGSAADSDKSKLAMIQTLQTQRRADGSRIYTPLAAVTLMVFYVFAMQCVSTVAVVRRETNSWRWPLFQWFYMGVLAWGLAFLTFHGGHWLGFR